MVERDLNLDFKGSLKPPIGWLIFRNVMDNLSLFYNRLNLITELQVWTVTLVPV